ncbi:MAG: hypothetical protein FWJ65_04320 [Limnochordales bacterium]
MSVCVVSLIRDVPQIILPHTWTIVKFPYTGESYDVWGMHNPAQPDGYQVSDWDADDRSGLIWPSTSGWGVLTAMIHWESGNYTELRDQFCRDPLGLSTGQDTTATDHRAPTPGMQFFTKTHQIFVNPATPLSLRVWHNAPGSAMITHAQFKLAIHTNVETPPAS